MKNYVKVFNGHEVPKGANHYDIRFRLPDYNVSRGQETKYYVHHTGKWVVSENGDDWHSENLIELPEAAQKWEPVVGEECEVESDTRGDWRESMYVGVDSTGSHVFDVEKKHLWRIDTTENHVRPKKSSKILEREDFTKKALSLLDAFDSYLMQALQHQRSQSDKLLPKKNRPVRRSVG
jgi:hypothetical protein